MAEIANLKKRKREPGSAYPPKKRRRVVRGAVALGTEVHTAGFTVSGDQHHMTVKSSTVLQQVYTANTSGLTIDARIPLHPVCINSYRLRQLSKLFTSYRFKEIVVKWVPRISTDTVGSVGVLYIDDISTAAASTLTNASNQNLSGSNLEAAIVESEDGFICPVWSPAVCFYDNLVNEQNAWFRVSLGSGMILDEIQGCIILAEGSNYNVGTEVGFFEMAYTIEFCHPVSPLTVAINGTLGSAGMTIPFSTMTGLVNYQIAGSTTDALVWDYWHKCQGTYLATSSTYAYTAQTTNWEFPCFLGQSYVITVRCFVTSTSAKNTSFSFYSSFGAFQNGDVLALSTGSIPTSDFSGFVMYLLVGTDNPNVLTSYNTVQQQTFEAQKLDTPSYVNSPFSSLSSRSIDATDRGSEPNSAVYAQRR